MGKLKWERGDKAGLAEACNISPQRLSNILSKRSMATAEQARKIVRVAGMMGYEISLEDCLYADNTNPLFGE